MSMLQKHRDALLKHRLELVQNLTFGEEFFTVLRQNDILTSDMVQTIECIKTTTGQAGKFLDILSRRGPDAFKTFIRALVESHQESLAKKLDAKMFEEVKKELAGPLPLDIVENQNSMERITEEQSTGDFSGKNSSSKLSQNLTVGRKEELGENKFQHQPSKYQTMEGHIVGQPTDGPGVVNPPAKSEGGQSAKNLPSDKQAKQVQNRNAWPPESVVMEPPRAVSKSLSEEWEEAVQSHKNGGAPFMSSEIDLVKKLEKVNNGRFVLIAEDADSPVENMNLINFFNKLGFKKDVQYCHPQTISEVLELECKILEKDTTPLDGFALMVMKRGVDGQIKGSNSRFVPDILKAFNEHPKLKKTLKIFCFQLNFDSPTDNNRDTVDVGHGLEKRMFDLSVTPSPNCMAALYVETHFRDPDPNCLPWAMIKIFSGDSSNNDLESLFNKVKDFMWKQKSITRWVELKCEGLK